MNTTAQTNNISNTERGSRLVLTAAMIGAVLAKPDTTPLWLAIVALYPAFTALLAWDPIYQLFTRRETSMKVDLIPAPVRSVRNVRSMGRAL